MIRRCHHPLSSSSLLLWQTEAYFAVVHAASGDPNGVSSSYRAARSSGSSHPLGSSSTLTAGSTSSGGGGGPSSSSSSSILSGSLSGSANTVAEALAAVAAVTTPLSLSNPNAIHKRDRWLAEVNYRHVLEQHQVMWEVSLDALAELHATARNAECRRRINLREYLIVFLNGQKQIFSATERMQSVLVDECLGLETDEETIQEELETAIAKRSAGSKHQLFDGLEAAVDEGAIIEHDRIGFADFYRDLFSTTYTLNSEHIVIAVVVETIRQDKMRMVRPKLSLAVITSTFLLHFFDVPTTTTPTPTTTISILNRLNPNNKQGAAAVRLSDEPEHVFDVIVSAASRAIPRGISATFRPELREYVIRPTCSLDLDHLECVMSDMDNAIDITVMSEAAGAPFQTICIRTNTARDQVSLLNSLHQQITRIMI